ncbi:MAG: tetratricopeptide repeat protein [Thermoguttaceae bacterium]
MRRLFLSLAVVFLGRLGIPANLSAQDYRSRPELYTQGEPYREEPKQTPAAEYENHGLDWINKGEYDKAIAECNQALAVNPKDALAYNNRGFAWKSKGEYEKAMAGGSFRCTGFRANLF